MSPKKKDEYKLNKDFYKGENAEFYANSGWMKRNQLKTAGRVYDLLYNEAIYDPNKYPQQSSENMLLDLGCGNGYSSEIFEDQDFRVVGLDISFNMLQYNIKQFGGHGVGKPNQRNPVLVNGLIEALPYRENSFDVIISISAFNFIIDEQMDHAERLKRIKDTAEQIFSVLKPHGRVVIEFYPSKADLDIYLKGFKKYFMGGLIIDNPGLRKEQKFMILRSLKENASK